MKKMKYAFAGAAVLLTAVAAFFLPNLYYAAKANFNSEKAAVTIIDLETESEIPLNPAEIFSILSSSVYFDVQNGSIEDLKFNENVNFFYVGSDKTNDEVLSDIGGIIKKDFKGIKNTKMYGDIISMLDNMSQVLYIKKYSVSCRFSDVYDEKNDKMAVISLYSVCIMSEYGTLNILYEESNMFIYSLILQLDGEEKTYKEEADEITDVLYSFYKENEVYPEINYIEGVDNSLTTGDLEDIPVLSTVVYLNSFHPIEYDAEVMQEY
ncbi:MAG: hypothetical protein ACI4I4_06115 [Acutalibacteraceae bacterium]